MSKLKKDFDWEKWDSMSPEEQEIAKDKAITWGRRRPGKVAVDKERKMRGYNIRKDGMFKCHNTKGEQVRWKPWSVESLWRQHNNPGWTRDEADVYNKLGKMPLRQAVSDERIQDIVSESIRSVLSEIYTMEDWQRDGKLKIHLGQIVADDVVEQLNNGCPPMPDKNGILYAGWPCDYDYNTRSYLFTTFKRVKSGWKYIGNKPGIRLP